MYSGCSGKIGRNATRDEGAKAFATKETGVHEAFLVFAA